MSTRAVTRTSRPAMDFSKYARPDLITAVSRVADFFGDAVQSVVLPPVCLVFITLALSYFLNFSNSFASVLFMLIGITGSVLTGLSYGALKFTSMASRDLKFIITEILYLVHNIVNDVSGYIKNPDAFPPLSEIVHGVIGTVIKPIIHGVFAKKFYGGLLNYAADPILGGVDKWLTSIVAVMEKRFAHTSPTKSKAIASGDENQKVRAENLDGEVIVKRDKLYETIENVRKRTVPKIDEYAGKLKTPLRISTAAFAVGTLLLTSLVYSM